jgi:hypothetical protein
MIVKLNVVTRLQDNGDGGYTMYVYNSQEEMLADHPLAEDNNDGKLTEKQKKKILSGDDEYENGYLGTDTITLDIDIISSLDTIMLNGKGEITNAVRGISLAEPLSFHAGQ